MMPTRPDTTTARPALDMRALCRACEDLRAPLEALQMASSGISAGMHANTATADGVYYLLEAVGAQLNTAIGRIETLLSLDSAS